MLPLAATYAVVAQFVGKHGGGDIRWYTGRGWVPDTISRYLERSGDWPSRLALDNMDIYGKLSRKESSLSHLAQHAHRWKAFKYQGYYALQSDPILSQLHVHFPSLEELDISSICASVGSNDLDCFEHAPKLRALATDKVPISRAPYHQLAHLSILITLTLRGLSLSDLDMIAVLQVMPSLLHLEIDDGKRHKRHSQDQKV
ncbi:hypothetical protein BDP27DRAFT_1424551 [Rhodocollybia butyracea]|uniref:Uncharacterized protein n=1 Tax=Rhodocollybia butyracea TaxID=206335 RepID=A0A9P5PPC1_9AGAR|nr:hypothetical protein BDP27DRAFT_1424551 [Rhodocollybia butyracea]